MIYLRIDLAKVISNEGHDQCLGWVTVPQAPEVGELVNVNGDPFHVINRGWAYDGTSPSTAVAEASKDATYCYIRVVGKVTS